MQDARPESLLFLAEVTRKIKTYLNDKRIARERKRRTGQAVSSRGWYAPAEMWVRGAVAVDQAAPEQQDAEQAAEVRTLPRTRCLSSASMGRSFTTLNTRTSVLSCHMPHAHPSLSRSARARRGTAPPCTRLRAPLRRRPP